MKLTVNTRELRDAIDLAIAAHPRDEEIVLQWVQESAAKLTLVTEGQLLTVTSIGIDGDSDGELYGTALYKLEQLLDPFDSEKVTITASKSYMLLQANKLRGQIALSDVHLDSGRFPSDISFNQEGPFAIVSYDQFRKAVADMTAVASRMVLGDRRVGHIEIVSIDKQLHMMATDSYKFGFREIENHAIINSEVVVQAAMLERVVRKLASPIDMIFLGMRGNRLVIGTPDWFVAIPTVGFKVTDLSQINKLVLTDHHKPMGFNRRELISAVKAAASVTKGLHIIEIDFSKYGTTVSTCIHPGNHPGEQMTGDQIIKEVSCEPDTDDWPDEIIQMHFNANYLLDLLEAMEGNDCTVFVGRYSDALTIMGDDKDIAGFLALSPIMQR